MIAFYSAVILPCHILQKRERAERALEDFLRICLFRRDRQEREEAEKAGKQVKEEETEDADMSNPFQPINHIVAEVSEALTLRAALTVFLFRPLTQFLPLE